MELLIIVFEERFTPKNSSNSSIPPSRGKTGRKKKTRKRVPKKKIQISDPLDKKNPDEVIDLYPEFCQCCGEEFCAFFEEYETRQVIDIVKIWD